ncbi:MAG: redoxin domain-containing protein [Acidobacteria bacterium]|nr:redoxin domain-containing protein [Acidobacteriota bacterium]
MRKRTLITLALVVLSLSCTVRPQSSNNAPVAAATRTAPVQSGEMAPDFTLEDQKGQKVTLSAARGQAPVVLVFYRGYW